MLSSIVLQLTAKENGRIHGSTGRAVHGFWYQQWQKTAPAIANVLHQVNGHQPFTLSPIMDLPHPQRGTTTIRQGHTAWLRLTTLHPEITQRALETWLPNLPDTVELATIPWQLQNIALMPQEHPYAAQTSYQTLEEKTPPSQTWQFEFKTPTTFHIGQEAYLPFPLPGALVNSWWRRWHNFAPRQLPPIDQKLLQEQLFVSHYQLKTVPVRHGRRLTIGCVGKITLRAGKRQADKLSAETLRTLAILARYATYCGSGKHTTQGMGLTILD
ncbi:CRISPR system precrRNA processing endoribonuclease RAMP protein Cas6 [Candidatus Leptofilum sp.]|uniref:CRISPR system precrRNA processing endoribonuclease RAMP protein Cas6 n=1 Tax=Candidatus Leptofilum sp. TaxID=3241576 RepID=UPI003B5BAECA